MAVTMAPGLHRLQDAPKGEGYVVKMERKPKENRALGAPFRKLNTAFTAKCVQCGVLCYGYWERDGVRESRAPASEAWMRVGGRHSDERCWPPTKTNGLRCLTCGPHPHPPPGWMGESGQASGQAREVEPPPSPIPAPVMPEPSPEPTPNPPVIGANEISALRARIEHLEGEVRNLTDVVTSAAGNVTRIEVRPWDGEVRTIDSPHMGLKQALDTVNAGFRNLYVAGPAGSGKTTLAVQLAKVLGLPFRYLPMTGGVNETHYLGVSRPNLTTGEEVYVESGFIRIYDKCYEGGVFLFDEVDGGDPNVVLGLNAPIDNGQVDNPYSRKVHYRHEKTIIIFSANTWGSGPTAEYCGRNQLDSATLNRFTGAKLFIDYDRVVERTLASEVVCHAVWGWRQKCQEKGIRRVLSSRDVKAAGMLYKAGMSLGAIQDRIMVDWTKDERAKVM